MRLMNLVIFFLCFAPVDAVSQQKNWGFEVTPKAGFLLAHRGVMGHLSNEHALGGEVSILKNTTGIKQWEQAYNYPKIGITAFASTIGNNRLLGQAFGTYGFIDYTLLRLPKMDLFFRTGAGLAYVTKVFDQELNPKNVAMSTHLNALICLGLKYRYYIGNMHLVAGIDLTHCSNGSTKVPNLGINLPYISLGVGKTFRSEERIHNQIEFTKRKWDFSAIGILSVKEVFPTGGEKFPIFALSLNAQKIIAPRRGFEAALDLIYKSSIRVYKLATNASKSDFLQLGIYGGYIIPLDKLQFVVGMGVYIRDVYNPDDRFYHRLGMRYKASKNLLINFTLKSHWAKADYVEYGIGYTF